MIESILRLFALRPLFTIAIMGVPLLVLIVLGLAAVLLFKLLLWVVLPIAIVWWLVSKLRRPHSAHTHASEPEPVATV